MPRPNASWPHRQQAHLNIEQVGKMFSSLIRYDKKRTPWRCNLRAPRSSETIALQCGTGIVQQPLYETVALGRQHKMQELTRADEHTSLARL